MVEAHLYPENPMKITNPQRKLLLALLRRSEHRLISHVPYRLAKGEWIAGRALTGKGLITESYPNPRLTLAGQEACKSLTH